MAEDRTELRNRLMDLLKTHLSTEWYKIAADLVDSLEDKAYSDGQNNVYEAMLS